MSDTKQINVRLPLELHKALADHKVRTGEDKSDVIRRGIESVLGVPTSYRAEDHLERLKNGTRPEPQPETVDLAAWLAGSTGSVRVLMRRAIKEGRVTVGGELWSDERLPKERLGAEIALDGRVVKPRRQNGQ